MNADTAGSTTMELRVVSADGAVFSGPVRMVSVSSTAGELGILPSHSPLVARLKPGELRMTAPDGEVDYLYVSGGFIEVQPEVTTVLADTALRGEEIDAAAAERARCEAEQAIADSVLYSDRDRARAELLKAVAQLKTLEDSRRARGSRKPSVREQREPGGRGG